MSISSIPSNTLETTKKINTICILIRQFVKSILYQYLPTVFNSFLHDLQYGCSCVQMSVQITCLICTSHKPHVRPIRRYLSTFKHLQIYSSYFQRICLICSILKGQKDMPIRPLCPFKTSDPLQTPNMTSLTYNTTRYQGKHNILPKIN
jgi:hypothetical protein